MNQGTIPSLFPLLGFYVAVVFFFKFKEVISFAKIIGIAIMIPAVLLLSLDKKVPDADSEYTQ